MAWVGDTIFSLSAALVCGVIVNTPESPETVRRDLRELGPHGIVAPPRIWESLLTDIRMKAADASWLKRRTYDYFEDLARRRELMKSDGKPIPFATACAWRNSTSIAVVISNGGRFMPPVTSSFTPGSAGSRPKIFASNSSPAATSRTRRSTVM